MLYLEEYAAERSRNSPSKPDLNGKILTSTKLWSIFEQIFEVSKERCPGMDDDLYEPYR